MLWLAQSSIEACGMSTNITFALVMIGFIVSIYLAGRIAERRGRSFKVWAWIAAVIGPLALPLVFLFPNLHRKNGNPA
jgi:MFS family permease